MMATYATIIAAVVAAPQSFSFSTRLDHFSSSNETDKFNMRYIMDD